MAVTQYANLADQINIGIAGKAIESVTGQARLASIEAASRLADGYLAGRFVLPLLVISGDLTRAVVNISIYDCMSNRGFSPAAGSDENIRLRYEDAIRWLENVAKGMITPQLTDSSTGATPGSSSTGGGDVITSSSRGFTSRGEGRGRVPFGGD